MLPSMTAVMTEDSMEQLVRSLETIHRALSAAADSDDDPRLTEAVATCLRDLHGIAAQAPNDGPARRFRLIDCSAPPLASENSGR